MQLRSLLAALTQHQQVHRAFIGGLSAQNDDQGQINLDKRKKQRRYSRVIVFY